MDERERLVERMGVALEGVAFQGASGNINFSASNRVMNDAVSISYYMDHQTHHLGRYTSTTGISMATAAEGGGGVTMEGRIGSDSPSSVYLLVPLSITSILAASVILCFLLTTAVLVLFVRFRNEPDIKAASPHLSYLMFLGCYMLFTATLVHTLWGAWPASAVGTVTVCGAVITGDSLGLNLIFTTLLLRMLRVYRIFSHFGKTGKLWSNKYMACIVGVVLLGDVVIILTWSLVDTFRVVEVVVYRPYKTPPHYEIEQFCSSRHFHVWLGVLLGKLAVLFGVVLFLAIKTRKIRRSNFKDTKKVNIYIFSTVMVVITFMTLFFLFTQTGNALAAHLMVYFAYGVTGLLCQLFLFLPKVTSPLLKRQGFEVAMDTKTRRHTLRRVSTATSKVTVFNPTHYTVKL